MIAPDVTPLLDDGDAPEFPDYDVVDSADLDAEPRISTSEARRHLLAQTSDPIDETDFGSDELNGLAAVLRRLVESERGYGLAAVQLGFPAAVFVLGAATGEAGVYVNPSIVRHGRDVETADEACLSLPHVRRPIPRWRVITARWQDLDGKSRETRLAGIAARAFQHEIDHLRGVTILDSAAGVQPEDE